MSEKFDSIDRARVVLHLQAKFSIRLKRIDNRGKYQVDQDGMRYVIFGGYGNWHGIPDPIVEDLESCDAKATMVVAFVDGATMRIFADPMDEFMLSVHSLNRPGDDKYDFHVSDCGDCAKIIELPEVTLGLCDEIPHTSVDRDRVAKKLKAEQAVSKLSDAEKEQLLQELRLKDDSEAA